MLDVSNLFAVSEDLPRLYFQHFLYIKLDVNSRIPPPSKALP